VVSISNSNQLVIHIKETPQCITTFLGHTNSVRALVASANDQIVVSGSYDHHVRIWNLLTGECKFNLSGHSNRIYTVEYIETSKRVFSGSMDNLIMIWDALTGSRIHILEGHNSLVGLLSVKTLPFMPFSTIVTPKSTRGSSDDCVNDKSIHIHRYEQHPVLISASADCTLRLWNPMKGTPISILYGHNSAVTCFHFDQDKVVSGSEHGIKLWDLRKPGNYFVRDIITGIQCAWNILMDDSKLVTAIQKDGLTWLEVYDFNSETVFEDLPEIEKYQEVLVSIGDKIIDKNPIEIMLDEIIQ
jgi:F-box and WD-40 domain protein CDC4